MSDTPETDNLARGNHVVPTEFAQDLERERDHWKSESLEQAKLLAMSADREERLRDALKYVAGLNTSQDASPQQCSAVLVAMEALQ
jgi:hypothetical protein